MAKQHIDTVAETDTIQDAFNKTNSNFDELYQTETGVLTTQNNINILKADKTYVDMQDAKLQTNISNIVGGVGNATLTNSPINGVGTYNVSSAGTYTNYGGVAVSPEDLTSGIVQLRLLDSVWTKVITPISLVAYALLSNIVNDLVSGGVTNMLSAEQGKVLKALIDAIPLYTTSDGVFAIQDTFANEAFSIDENGVVDFSKISDNLVNVILSKYITPIDGGGYEICDTSGQVAFSIDENGVVDFNTVGTKLTSIIREITRDTIPTPPSLSKYTDVNHIINYGQSLSVGQSDVVVTNTNLYPNLKCFDGVVRTSSYDLSLTGDVYPMNRRISFAPITERINDGDSPGILMETPTSGILEGLATEINKFAYETFPTLPMTLLGSAPGWGSTTIAQLSKGGAYYPVLILDVQAGLSIANSLGQEYKVLAVTWTQGESDYLAKTGEDTYKASLIQLRDDLNADIKAITGQTDDVAIVMYQTATSNGGGGGSPFPNIALAQLDLALNEPGFYMATAMYQMLYINGFHMKGASYKMLGNYYGLAINKIISENFDFKPVHVTSSSIQGSLAKLKFYVPVKPLVFDSANSVLLPNKGFAVMLNGVDILSSVSIGLDGDSVVLSCSQSPAGAMVQYAINLTSVTNTILNLGNLRDSQTPLQNWVPIFQYQL